MKIHGLVYQCSSQFDVAKSFLFQANVSGPDLQLLASLLQTMFQKYIVLAYLNQDKPQNLFNYKATMLVYFWNSLSVFSYAIWVNHCAEIGLKY